MRHHHNPATSGFTLMECLIAVAIAAILSAIAIPWYGDHVRRSHRANARTTLLQAAHWLERAATASGTYPQAGSIPQGILQLDGSRSSAGLSGVGVLTVIGERYTVMAASQDGLSYTLTATPTTGSAQAVDACGALVLDQAGRRTVLQTRLAATECWSR